MPDFRMFYEYSMTLRELLQSVDAEAYTSIPLYKELLKTKPEYGSSNRIKVKVLNREIAVSRSTFGRLQGKNYIEDERRESLADSEVERSELLRQIFTMIRKTVTEQETDILCAYYGLQTKRLTVNKIAEKHLLPEKRVLKIVRESERKLQFLRPVSSKRAELERSDDAIEIWKYLYRR